MSFLDTLKDGANNVLGQLKESAARFKHSGFRDKVIAICALAATADGVIQAQEKEKVKKLIMGNAALSHFKPTELGALFEEYCKKAMDEFGRLDVEQVVSKNRSDASEDDVAVKIGLIIVNADGVFEESEKAAMREIIKLLGLSAATYGL
jgi:tellurite resistance protein TerB